MRDVMFNIPSQRDVTKCIIDGPCITQGKAPTMIYKHQNSSEDHSDSTGELGVS